MTSGGRVLCAVGLGATVRAAQKQAYELAGTICWEGLQYRRDIGYRAIARECSAGESRRLARKVSGVVASGRSGRSSRAAERQTRARENDRISRLRVRRLSEFSGKPENVARRINFPPKRAEYQWIAVRYPLQGLRASTS